MGYILDNYGINYIFYILSILAILSSFLLFSIMPSQKLIRTEIHSHNFKDSLLSMIRLIFFGHLPTAIFLSIIGIITFVNSSLTLLLAPWLFTDYSLSITEFGYCTVIIGTAQIVAIIFSYQFGNKLGVGWSLLSGILVQCLMFIFIYLFNKEDGIIYEILSYNSSHYTFPLLFILLLLSIHFIAAEFTYINAVSCMLQIAPIQVIQSKLIAANAMRFITSICRILGAVFAPYLWFYSDDGGSFQLFSFIAMILLSIAFLMHLMLMLYIYCVWDKNKEDEEYMVVSSNGDSLSNRYNYDENEDESYLFQNEMKEDEEEMDDAYIAKILSANIDFTIL